VSECPGSAPVVMNELFRSVEQSIRSCEAMHSLVRRDLPRGHRVICKASSDAERAFGLTVLSDSNPPHN
jgi:hypothetical protein